MQRIQDGQPDVTRIGSLPPRSLALARFDDFYTDEYRRVLALAVVLCGRRDIAEETTQDAFLSAYKHWDRIVGYEDPGAWVRRVAVNLATSALRRRTREVRALARLSMRRSSAPLPVEADEELWVEVRRLPPRQAQCVALRYVEDRSITEIASVLGIAASTVRVHLHAGRKTLAGSLGEALGEEEP